MMKNDDDQDGEKIGYWWNPVVSSGKLGCPGGGCAEPLLKGFLKDFRILSER